LARRNQDTKGAVGSSSGVGSIDVTSLASLGIDIQGAEAPPVFGAQDDDFKVIRRQPVARAAGAITTIRGVPQVNQPAGHFLTPPLFDSYVWRTIAQKIKTSILAYNQAHNSNFFNDFPEALLVSAPTSLYSINAQVDALTTVLREYVNAWTMLMGALATCLNFGRLTGFPSAVRWGLAMRVSILRTIMRGLEVAYDEGGS